MERTCRIEIDDLKKYITLEEEKENRKYGLVEIDVELVDKIISKIIVDNKNSINIMLKSMMNKLNLKITHKIVIKVRLAD